MDHLASTKTSIELIGAIAPTEIEVEAKNDVVDCVIYELRAYDQCFRGKGGGKAKP